METQKEVGPAGFAMGGCSLHKVAVDLENALASWTDFFFRAKGS